MFVYLNGEKHSLGKDCNLMHLLGNLGIKDFNGMAVAVNDEVIPRTKWNLCPLNENDKVLIIRAAQGG